MYRTEMTNSLQLLSTVVILASGASSRTGGTSSAEDCLLPSSWWGIWFQKGIRNYMTVDTKNISSKGSCIKSYGYSRFLMEDNSSTERCYRCMIITHKHHNIMQYRETRCHTEHNAYDLCNLISSDQEMYSMFRVDAEAIRCPLEAPYTFAYKTASGKSVLCSNPLSRVDSCAVKSQLQFTFQACADVRGSQSSVEKLTCLATWREGPVSYLIAKIDHNLVSDDDDRYRCFVYSRVGRNRVILSQSEDATCNGLRESNDGARVMHLNPVEGIKEDCSFPRWITSNGLLWYGLGTNSTYTFATNGSFVGIDHKASDNGEETTRTICVKNTSSTGSEDVFSYRAITHFTSGCNQGYSCLIFRRRQRHIIEMIIGPACVLPSRRQVESSTSACTRKRGTSEDQIILAALGDEVDCSKMYSPRIRSLKFFNNSKRCDSPSEIRFGCDGSSWITVRHDRCFNGPVPSEAYRCHFTRSSNRSTQLVTSINDRQTKYCFTLEKSKNHLTIHKDGDCSDVTPINDSSDRYIVSDIEWCDDVINGCQRLKFISVDRFKILLIIIILIWKS